MEGYSPKAAHILIKAVECMTFNAIKAKAEKLGINPINMNRTELIHTIQIKEGFNPCYGHFNNCPYVTCTFRIECIGCSMIGGI
jgi:hypothetical protein